MAVCPYCKNYVSTKEASKTYKGKKYHADCFNKILDDLEEGDTEREKLNKYICEIFEIDRVSPLIDKQISEFTKINGYTISGIYNTLKYFFSIGERDVGEDVRGIGIVPYVYEEAKEYFETIKKATNHNKNFVPVITEQRIQIRKPDYSVNKIDISKIE